MSYDKIKEIQVEKKCDKIVEVDKFNPFHDARGRFSNKNGFASYSANPNTRAGAMAIARSAAAGHGSTVNVHRDSYGENIRQNANWIGQGKTTGMQGAGALRYRVEPVAGLGGASAAGASWQFQNQQQGRTTGQGKKPAQPQSDEQQPQKPAQPNPAQQNQQQSSQQGANTLASKVSDVYLSTGDKLAMQPRDGSGSPTTTKKIANDHYQEKVDGKDISGTADVRKVKGKDPIDAMAELQGWNKAPTVTNDLETFQKLAKKNGGVMIRSVTPSSITGESADQVCKSTMTNGDYALGGSGLTAYGTGRYFVNTAFGSSTGRNLAHKIAAGQRESYYYGSKQMMATTHPKAKIATDSDARSLRSQFTRMKPSDRARFGNDLNTYIASKGYDGVKWHPDSDPGAYTTIFNMSAMVFYGGVASR